MINVIILGGRGALGSCLTEILSENSNLKMYHVVRNKKLVVKDNIIYWDYMSKIPIDFLKADVIVNCARSENFNFNLRFNKNLIDALPESIRLINISSNAVFAKPNGFFSNFIFRGDAYIREKKLIEKYSIIKRNVLILRPTIVTDEGGWRSFFDLCKSSKKTIGPFHGEFSKVKITKRRYVARQIEACILGNKKFSEEIYESIDETKNVVGSNLEFNNNSNNYFENNFKNLLLVILSSWILPDKLVFYLQDIMIKKSKNVIQLRKKYNNFVIEGMTRLYLFGRHTNDL